MGLSNISRNTSGTRTGLKLILPLAMAALTAFCLPQSADAQQYASRERTNAALGHYARARTMLVQALAEFEQGRKYARPDMLLDPEEWRLSVVSRTEELNRILDPRPRVTREGVRFQANKLLIRRERDRLPAVADGAQDGSNYGEAQRKKGMRTARARLDRAGINEKSTSKKKSGGKAAAAKKSVADKGVPESAEEVLLDEEASPSAAIGNDDAIVAAGQAAAKATTAQEKVEDTKGAPVIEAEEEEVDARAPILPESAAKRSLFGDEKSPAAAKKSPVIDDEKKEVEVSKAIEDALAERLKLEKPVAEKSEEEVLEDEIVRQ